jgi:sulfur carrier protein
LQILLNGEPIATEAQNLDELCAGLGLGDARIATAINGNFVAADRRGETKLAPADSVEIVAPRQGG